MMTASEPSPEERNLHDRFRPTIEDEQNNSSVSTMQCPKDNIFNTATEDSTPDVSQTKLQDATQTPHGTKQEEDDRKGDR